MNLEEECSTISMHHVAVRYVCRSLPPESPATTTASLLPGCRPPVPRTTLSLPSLPPPQLPLFSLVVTRRYLRPRPSPPTLHLIRLAPLFTLHGQSRLPALALESPRPTASHLPDQSHLPALAHEPPRPTASLLPVSLACRHLHPPAYSMFAESAPAIFSPALCPPERYQSQGLHGKQARESA